MYRACAAATAARTLARCVGCLLGRESNALGLELEERLSARQVQLEHALGLVEAQAGALPAGEEDEAHLALGNGRRRAFPPPGAIRLRRRHHRGHLHAGVTTSCCTAAGRTRAARTSGNGVKSDPDSPPFMVSVYSSFTRSSSTLAS